MDTLSRSRELVGDLKYIFPLLMEYQDDIDETENNDEHIKTVTIRMRKNEVWVRFEEKWGFGDPSYMIKLQHEVSKWSLFLFGETAISQSEHSGSWRACDGKPESDLSGKFLVDLPPEILEKFIRMVPSYQVWNLVNTCRLLRTIEMSHALSVGFLLEFRT
jgi:hypothetical protein